MHSTTSKQNQPPAGTAAAANAGVVIQPKLSIGAVNDPLEHEADAMADKVMSMQDVAPVAATNYTAIQRKCHDCEEEKLQRKPLSSFIQRKAASDGIVATDTISSQVNASKGAGSSMDSGTSSFMQSRFGTDFSSIRIHTGGEAVQMNRELNAKAFTVGSDIYFNEGQYNPGTGEGRHLLAHELTHTVQQGSGSSIVQRKIRVDPGLDLDTMGFTVSKSGNDYTCPKVTKSSVWNEIFSAMLHSPRIFKVAGKTNAEINANLYKHMAARIGIIEFAAKKKYDFGAGSSSKVNPKYWSGPLKLKPGANLADALDDLNINPKEYAIACLAATTMTMMGGAKSNWNQQSSSDPDDWVPGDWGYIENMKFSGRIGLEGENLIYVGKDKYWGHFTGTNTYRTFQEWFDEVESWDGEAKTKDSRRIPVIGLE